MRYWEDFTVGETTELGTVAVTREEIIEFAQRYDPQPFHVDDAAADGGPYGGLIASGWHTASLFMGLFVRSILLDAASMGSPGVEELRWTAPVRPGDRLTGRVTVTAAEPSSKRADRGTVFTTSEVLNQDGAVVMTMKARGFFRRRDAAT
ncbi:MAG TPA: MaoC family dehydratase [Gaiellaceae bacterium]|nr:MaoC family dehydratase [Gaiellaceae bacterium]